MLEYGTGLSVAGRFCVTTGVEGATFTEIRKADLWPTDEAYALLIKRFFPTIPLYPSVWPVICASPKIIVSPTGKVLDKTSENVADSQFE